MLKTRSGFVMFVAVLACFSATAMGESLRQSVKAQPREEVEREFDPDAGTEAPIEGDWEYDGGVAGTADGCDTVGSFVTPFQFPSRYRGNLYSIVDSGVRLKEIKMMLAFTGVADLYVSVHRRLPNGSYTEVDLDLNSPIGFIYLPAATGLGANSPAYYSSGPLNGGLGIELIPGDYAIGFAWGPENVKFGRNAASYPLPISVGSTLASVSRELGATEPPLPATLTTLSQFTGGAYAQELCFIPVEGACCLSDGDESRCVNVLEANCVGEGSYFHGQRTTCKDTICVFGGCCFECDDAANGFAARCEDNYTQQYCTAAGGIQFWGGASCGAELCPKIVGACCNGTNCSLKCETECVAGGGSYEGDGTNCDPNTHVCKGACCVTGGCLDRTQSGCSGLGGTFKGRGTRCFSETCGGACCYGFTGLDFCEVHADRTLCAYDPDGFEKIAYRGDGTVCPRPDPPFNENCGLENQYKACCLPDPVPGPNGLEVQCINTTQAVCTAPWIQGTYLSTGTCDTLAPNQCENMLTRCCFGNGTCEVLIGNACVARGGTQVAGQNTCPANGCTTFAGACCTSAGTCEMKTAVQCSNDGGSYQGDESCCSDVPGCAAAATCPGFGACCRGNSECIEGLTPAQCSNVAGVYRGASTTCAQVACDLRGACCAVTGTCLFTTVTTCVGIGGDFKGAGASCTPGICPSGACCLPEGCKRRTPVACDAAGGDYTANGDACEPDTCVVQGGCCRAGVCTVEDPALCTGAGAIYLGNGTACSETACTTGACCRITGSCDADIEEGACAGPGEEFHTGQACTGQCVPRGACCVGTDCDVTLLSQCAGTYQGNGVQCAFNTCAATGACCNGANCSTLTSADCASGGGVYQGDNISCSGACSEPANGACCNGIACNFLTQADCTSGGGVYQGDGVLCGAGTCDVPASGACCNGEDCTVDTQAACSSGGGVYQGDATDCESNPCQPGECSAILDRNPAQCAIDARRPHPPNAPGSPQGWDFIDLTFDCDTANHVAGDYAVSVIGVGPAPTVSTVTPSGTSIRVSLSGPISAGDWTCITYTPANLMTCLGFLPGDINSNRATNPSDIIMLIDHLNGIVLPPLSINQCDVDRSNACVPADIITLIDLLNGTNGFQVWNGKSLPACPTVP